MRKARVPSPDTVLRILHSIAEANNERGPRVLGVEEIVPRPKQHTAGSEPLDHRRGHRRCNSPVHYFRLSRYRHGTLLIALETLARL